MHTARGHDIEGYLSSIKPQPMEFLESREENGNIVIILIIEYQQWNKEAQLLQSLFLPSLSSKFFEEKFWKSWSKVNILKILARHKLPIEIYRI